MSDLQEEAAADGHLAERLLRGGIAPRHVRRSLRELGDHRLDLIDQLVQDGFTHDSAISEACLRLGDRDMLARQMLIRPELRSRARRFAWLLFGVAPLLATLVMGVIVFFTALAIGGYDLDSRAGDPAHAGSLQIAEALLHWAVPAGVGLLLCVIALRRRMPAAWPVVGITLTALISSGTSMDPHQIAIGAPPIDEDRALILSGVLVVTYLLARHAMTRTRRKDA